MPLKLLSPGGGSVLLQANTTSLDYTLTVPAETANLITTASSTGINASAMSLGTIPTARMPTGSMLQVVQTVITGTFSTSGTTFVDITGMAATITPTSSTSKILVDIVMSCGEGSDAFPAFYVRRNGTIIVLANALSPGTQSTFGYTNTGNDARDQYLLTPVPFKYLDSPGSTSALTYQVQVRPMGGASRTFYLNRPGTVGDSNQIVSISTMTLTEIAG